jgi:nucleotide-binding universal stress UspA family protein
MRRVLVAVSGLLLSEFLGRVLSQLTWTDVELDLLHVVDARPLREFGLLAGNLPGHSGQTSERLRQMGALGAEAGQRMLAEAEAFAGPRLPAGATIRRLQRTGVPEHEIIATAHEIGVSLIVLGAAEDPASPPPPPPGRHGTGPTPHESGKRPPLPTSGGPPKFPRRQLSPTVRFIVDHAPCDVLLLYAGELRKASEG